MDLQIPGTLGMGYVFSILGWDWDLNLGLQACKAGTLPLETHFQSILLWLVWRWGLLNYLPGLASNREPPRLSFPSS
jgi:hypothetical protein